VLEEEIATRFDASRGPLARANLLHDASSSVLTLTFHHSIADGRGAMYFLRDVLRVLGGERLEDSMPLQPLGAATEQALGTPLPKPVAEQGEVKTRRPINSSGRADGRPSVISAAIPASTCSRLLRRARTEGTTVHGALGAALTCAMGELVAGYETSPARVLSPVDLRTMVAQGSEALGYCVTGHVTELGQFGSSFWDTARAFKDGFQPLHRLDEVALKVASWGSMTEDARSGEEMLAALMRAQGPEAVLSNLGKLDFRDTYRNGHVELLALWGPTAAIEIDQQVIGVTTFGGVLRMLHTSYRPVLGLLTKMIDIIEEAA
jgi:hypothetical protein